MNYYDLCCKFKGRVVTITDIQGQQYCGRIVDVDDRYVYLERNQRGSALGGYGYGYGYYGGYYGYPRYGYYGYPVWPVALAAIGGFALGAAFLW